MNPMVVLVTGKCILCVFCYWVCMVDGFTTVQLLKLPDALCYSSESQWLTLSFYSRSHLGFSHVNRVNLGCFKSLRTIWWEGCTVYKNEDILYRAIEPRGRQPSQGSTCPSHWAHRAMATRNRSINICRPFFLANTIMSICIPPSEEPSEAQPGVVNATERAACHVTSESQQQITADRERVCGITMLRRMECMCCQRNTVLIQCRSGCVI